MFFKDQKELDGDFLPGSDRDYAEAQPGDALYDVDGPGEPPVKDYLSTYDIQGAHGLRPEVQELASLCECASAATHFIYDAYQNASDSARRSEATFLDAYWPRIAQIPACANTPIEYTQGSGVLTLPAKTGLNDGFVITLTPAFSEQKETALSPRYEFIELSMTSAGMIHPRVVEGAQQHTAACDVLGDLEASNGNANQQPNAVAGSTPGELRGIDVKFLKEIQYNVDHAFEELRITRPPNP